MYKVSYISKERAAQKMERAPESAPLFSKGVRSLNTLSINTLKYS